MYLSDAMRKRIKELIEENNSNGNKLALESGIDRSSVFRFLKGQYKSIKIETITLICQSLNISLKEFFDSELFKDVEVKD